MNAPPVPDDYQPPISTVLVPIHIWEQIKGLVPEDCPLSLDLERLEDTERQHQEPEMGSMAYQILDILAKSDGNLTEHMSRHTLNVMYGQMAQNLVRAFTITRKEEADGEQPR